jgi:hypothetical protein
MHSTTGRNQCGIQWSVALVFNFKSFNILYQPSQLHHIENMRSVVLACVILHNMIVEVRRDGYAGVTGDSFLFEPSGATSINNIPKARTVQESNLPLRGFTTEQGFANIRFGEFEFSNRQKIDSNSIRANSNSNCHCAIRLARIYRARIRS